MLKILSFWNKKDDDEYKEQSESGLESFSAPANTDGAIEVERQLGTLDPYAAINQSFFVGDVQSSDTENLINTYRSLASFPEVSNAIQEIVTDAIVTEEGRDVVYLNMDSTDFSDKIKNKINDEFDDVLSLLKFKKEGASLFRQWYIDSRIFFHKILHKQEKEGIQELRLLDPRRLEFIREIETDLVEDIKIVKGTKESFLYTTEGDEYRFGITSTNQQKLKIPKSAIVYAHSGIKGPCGRRIIGELHNAIKPANQLRMLEDALVIYRITRAPERRVFYIDVGTMPNKKAVQYTNGIMQSLKNRTVYDTSTGKVKNQFNNLSMTEDYFLMRRDGNAKTEVSQLPGAQSLGEINDVTYFNQKLYEALQIPLSRIPNMQAGGVSFSGGGEITRDELKFAEFIRRLQSRFEDVFLDPLKTNLILRKVISEEEWDENVERIKVVFNKNSYYEEMKDIEILERRVQAMQALEGYIGRYISNEYVMKNIFKMSDDQIEREAKLIEEESEVERFKPIDQVEEF
ncbi:MAG: hypothetical protein [Caudoviricetes sp.]|nr:MAG: hypothetical protein [Caudoviricetes sp.]